MCCFALIGPRSFELLVNMSAPAEPTAKLFDMLKELLMNYYKISHKITEHMDFRKQKQEPGEYIMNYVAELQKLNHHCGQDTDLDDNLRYMFVAGN